MIIRLGQLRLQVEGGGNKEQGTRKPDFTERRIFGMVLFKRKVTDQEVRPAGQRQLQARSERDSCSECLSRTRNWHNKKKKNRIRLT